MTLPRNVLIDPDCEPLDPRLEERIVSMIFTLKIEGQKGRINLGPEHDYCLHKLPHGVHRLRRKGAAGSAVRPPRPPRGDYSWGPAMWNELHQAARRLKTPAERKAFLADFRNRLPCGDCGAHWDSLLVRIPPALKTSGAFFLCTFLWHNAVNERTKKPLFAFADAESLYPVPK